VLLLEVVTERQDRFVERIERADADVGLCRSNRYAPSALEAGRQHLSKEGIAHAEHVVDAHVPVVVAQQAALDILRAPNQFCMDRAVAHSPGDGLARKDQTEVFPDGRVVYPVDVFCD
jgi:hypothetical protein